MARGYENKKIVEDFLKEFQSCTEFLRQMIPCIIPDSEEDGKILKQGLNAIAQLDNFIEECDGNLGDLDEVFDIDKIVEDYPRIKELFSSSNNSLYDKVDQLREECGYGDEESQ